MIDSFFMQRGWIVLMAVVAVATACSNSSADDAALPPLTTEPTSSNTPDSTEPATATAEAPEATTDDRDDVDSDAAAVERLWVEFVEIAASRTNQDQLTDLATPETIEVATTRFFEERQPQTFYTQIDIVGITATIQDCVLLERPLSDFHYIPMTGRARLTNDTWQLTSISINNPDRCLPGNVAAEILQDYEDHWDANTDFRNPPDPEHPLLEATTSGPYLERILEVLDVQIERNIGWRGRPETNPVILEFTPGFVLLDDCQTPAPDTGTYDLDTGERTDDFPEIAPGQTDDTSMEMILENGAWKADSHGADRNVPCTVNEPDAAIPFLGPVEVSS